MVWLRPLAVSIIGAATLSLAAPASAAPPRLSSVEPRGAEPAAGILDHFAPEDKKLLLAYKSVTRASSFEHGARRYFTGISYQVVDMTADELFGLLQHVDETLPKALPATHKARYIGNFGGLPLVEMVHGNGFWNKSYTLIWQPVSEHHEVQFWLFADHPHDIEDVWGFLRVTPFEPGGRSLVTVAIALDLGHGGAKSPYEGKVQEVILKSARYIRKFVDRRHGKIVE